MIICACTRWNALIHVMLVTTIKRSLGPRPVITFSRDCHLIEQMMKLILALTFLSFLVLSSAINYGDNVSPIAYLQSNNLNTGKGVSF